MLDEIDPAAIADPTARALIIRLLNVVDQQAGQLRAAMDEIQLLRDEKARRKGEQGPPKINPQAPLPAAPFSSEAERRTPKPRQPRSKQAHLNSTREEVCRLDRATLPPDAQFKGYEDVVVQDLRIECDTIRFRKEKFYSPSHGQTFLSPLSGSYHGQFGSDLWGFLLSQYFAVNTSEAKLAQFLGYLGIQISRGQIFRRLTEAVDPFHAENSAVLAAGLACSDYQQLDETGTRVNGENYSCHVLTNPVYTAYRTTAGNHRLSVLRALTDSEPLGYLLTAHVRAYLAQQGLVAKWQLLLAAGPAGQVWSETELTVWLAEWGQVPPRQAKLLREGLALGAYQVQTTWRPVAILLVGDAPQWRHRIPAIGLCWVHEGRHYKKLLPVVGCLVRIQARFVGRFWRYYDQLRAYQMAPDADRARWLRAKFRRVFNTVTAYQELNQVIMHTKAKETAIVAVLAAPHLPLHNNAAELRARVRVCKRDVSFGPRSPAGLKAWDTFMTLVQTTRKVGVNFYAYVRDRLRGRGEIPPLAELVTQKVSSLQLIPA